MDHEPGICPVVLSGGSGTRLWPMSRDACPKQLISLMSDRSLLQETVARTATGGKFTPPVVVCNAGHRSVVSEQLCAINSVPRAVLLEPTGRNTAPAAAVASLMLAEEPDDALILLLPSDHAISDVAAFHDAVGLAAPAAADGALVTFGIRPTGPETGYGYIHCGAPLAEHTGCFSVADFIEKPDRSTAERYVASGNYAWNSGMFMFSPRSYLDEIERLEPEILARCREAFERAETDRDFVSLAKEPFAACPSESIDYAIMEHTDRAAVVPVDMGWSDVGSWAALWDEATKDDAGNVVAGDVVALDSAGSYLRSDGPLVATLGVEDVIVVATADAVLVLPRHRAQEVRTIVDTLKSRRRTEATHCPRAEGAPEGRDTGTVRRLVF